MPSILITGCAKRLGAIMAKHLAGKGYEIAIHYNTSQEDAKNLQKEIKETNKKENPLIQCDLTGDITPLINIIREKKITNLINNASMFYPQDLYSITEKSFLDMMKIHAIAPMMLSKEVAMNTRDTTKDCFIINMLDVNINLKTSKYLGYNLAKKSLADQTEMLKRDVPKNLKIGSISPDFIDLNEKEKFLPSDRKTSSVQWLLNEIDEIIS